MPKHIVFVTNILPNLNRMRPIKQTKLSNETINTSLAGICKRKKIHDSEHSTSIYVRLGAKISHVNSPRHLQPCTYTSYRLKKLLDCATKNLCTAHKLKMRNYKLNQT